MANYINTETLQYPVTVRDIKAMSPNTSFPNSFVADEPYAPVLPSPRPPYDPVLQSIRQTTPIKQGNEWMEQWEVVDKYHDYTDNDGVFHPKAEQEAQAIVADEVHKKADNRQQAERLLQESDWTQIPDVNLVNKAEFAVYRAEVRAIALNPPTTVGEWPAKPEEIWT